jgi:phycocyanobilin lyase subunit beta
VIVVAAVLLMLVSACERHDEPPADPYVVSVDVGPHIRAFGEETLTADEAGEHLALLGPDVVPALAAALEREPTDVRIKAVEVLATIGSPDAVPALVRTARHDGDVNVRGDALRALGTIGDGAGLEVIEEGLGDVRLAVRAGAVMGCAGLCSTPRTIDRLATIAIHDPDVSVALAARTSLNALRPKDETTTAAIDAAITRRTAEASTPDQRALAALLRSDVDRASSGDALAAALAAASPPLQRQLAWRLGVVGAAGAVAPLATLLDSADPMVRLYAVDALARLDDGGVAAAGAALARYAGPKPQHRLGVPEY